MAGPITPEGSQKLWETVRNWKTAPEEDVNSFKRFFLDRSGLPQMFTKSVLNTIGFSISQFTDTSFKLQVIPRTPEWAGLMRFFVVKRDWSFETDQQREKDYYNTMMDMHGPDPVRVGPATIINVDQLD